jgi:hypothetical protein
MAEIIKHPQATEFTYTIFVDGKEFNKSKVYDYIYNRALGVALYLKCEFENTRSPLITDKWKSEKHMIIIQKSK